LSKKRKKGKGSLARGGPPLVKLPLQIKNATHYKKQKKTKNKIAKKLNPMSVEGILPIKK
jgi:hypothetical protein